jgi:AcrR family transcriptional regulator
MMTVQRPRSDTKERLRAHALEIIATDGVRALSVRTLCRGVGIRESSFYSHFTGKEALVEELLQHAGADGPMRIAEALAAKALCADAYVRQLTTALTQLWTEAHGRKLRVLLESEAARTPALRHRFNTGVLAMIDLVGQELQRHVAAGALEAHAAPRVLAWSLVAPIGALRFSLFAHGSDDASVAEGIALADAHADAWLRAYGVRGGA